MIWQWGDGHGEVDGRDDCMKKQKLRTIEKLRCDEVDGRADCLRLPLGLSLCIKLAKRGSLHSMALASDRRGTFRNRVNM